MDANSCNRLHAAILRAAAEGLPPARVARRVRCSISTVYKVLRDPRIGVNTTYRLVMNPALVAVVRARPSVWRK